jgi:hypothetical protein
MEIERQLWLDVIIKKVPPRFKDLNLKAFETGFAFRP